MIIDVQRDSDGNIIYEEHDTGYFEINTYKDGKLIRTESHYPKGQIEVEQYNTSRD